MEEEEEEVLMAVAMAASSTQITAPLTLTHPTTTSSEMNHNLYYDLLQSHFREWSFIESIKFLQYNQLIRYLYNLHIAS